MSKAGIVLLVRSAAAGHCGRTRSPFAAGARAILRAFSFAQAATLARPGRRARADGHCRVCRRYFFVKTGTAMEGSNLGYQTDLPPIIVPLAR